jgi:3-oxoacyl-[acyl-carrier protein] reductase
MSESSGARVAIVTGAARGIGKEIAARLAGLGYAVAALDLDVDAARASTERLSADGAAALGVWVDVADEDSVAAAVDKVAASLGPPVVLVNNAGVTRDRMLFKMSVAEWDTVIGVHLRGAFLMTRAVQGFMREANWGRVVNISSTSALGLRGQINYSSAKAGIQGFTKTAAIELGRFGVTVNAVAPGFIETDMTRDLAERIGRPWDEYVRERAEQTAVGRTGTPGDVAHAVAYFVSDEAGYVTGQVLYVAGSPRT